MVSIRQATAADAEFAYRVLEKTMKDYAVATFGGSWKEHEARAEMAADAEAGVSCIIEHGGVACGLLKTVWHTSHVQLESLFLLPKYQRRGIGGGVVEQLVAAARLRSVPVRLRVLRINPAKRFYERLGFVVTGETQERFFMERVP
jgi:GNAT superfamily N-acetyltransferase